MNKRMWLGAAVLLTVILVFGAAVLFPARSNDAAAQGLCEYVPFECAPYQGHKVQSYYVDYVEEPKADGACLLYDVAKTAPEGVALVSFVDSTGEPFTGPSYGPIRVCGDVIHFYFAVPGS